MDYHPREPVPVRMYMDRMDFWTYLWHLRWEVRMQRCDSFVRSL